MGIDIHSFPVTLGVQAFPLLEDDERDARRQDGGQRHQPGDESAQAVGDDEAGNGSARRSRSPVDVPALDAHELKGPLEPLEQRIVQITLVPAFHRACRLADTEEQGQGLCRRNQEDAGADDHHDLLLQNLLPNCKVLNINTPKKQKVPKETNWKQKFQKPQNEDICLTYLNTEMNGNFHFLSFCAAFLKVQNQVL